MSEPTPAPVTPDAERIARIRNLPWVASDFGYAACPLSQSDLDWLCDAAEAKAAAAEENKFLRALLATGVEDNDRLAAEVAKWKAAAKVFDAIMPAVYEERDALAAEVARLRGQLNEQISYTETVDAMLDGIVPARRSDVKNIWLKERMTMLINNLNWLVRNEQRALGPDRPTTTGE